ncbi:MAG: hypothetical protein QGH15_23200 [Kiritimatiellia bacterium]|jgi:hypothetical protein|nr:hypothetical protein [Kiritimatiellia bacterium]
MRKWFMISLAVRLLCAVALFGLVGCEDDADTDDVSSHFDDGSTSDARTDPYADDDEGATIADPLTVSPDTVELDNDGDMSSFDVSGGTSPYSYSVQDVYRGSIVSEGSSGCVYQRGTSGDNAVIVTDDAGDTVYAIIEQP